MFFHSDLLRFDEYLIYSYSKPDMYLSEHKRLVIGIVDRYNLFPQLRPSFIKNFIPFQQRNKVRSQERAHFPLIRRIVCSSTY